jgi:hypothetical protein
LVDKHPSFRELRVAAETQSAYRLPICMVVEVVLLATRTEVTEDGVSPYCTRHHHDAPGVLLGTTRSP